MVRVNPLIPIQQQKDWMEGPYWQHTPPLFAYIPLPLFKIDGQVTIEIKRLSYALMVLFGGIIFILSIAKFDKNYLATIAATLAATIWVKTPFTRNLITGLDFGALDIVWAFAVICCFAALCLYLKNDSNIKKICLVEIGACRLCRSTTNFNKKCFGCNSCCDFLFINNF